MRGGRGSSGFTLIECIISLLVLAVAVYLVVAWLGRTSPYSRDAALASLPAAIAALRVDLENEGIGGLLPIDAPQTMLVWREVSNEGIQRWRSSLVSDLSETPTTAGVPYIVELEQMEDRATLRGLPLLISFYMAMPPLDGEPLTEYLERIEPADEPLCQYPLLLKEAL